jgi:alkanesulfonate monooxygenase SsuD/methylene tetrahydromethanopterin reductase-like flavin-dependent oxidoreductase (luciferase family)
VLDDTPAGAAALADYRDRAGDRACIVVSLDVLVGDPELALPEAWALAAARSTGEFPPLEPPDPDRPLSTRQRTTMEGALRRTIVGDEETVATRLDALLTRTGADELLVSSSTFDRAALAESDARLAALLS